ncbi:MAG: metallophosphoesterase family protein [Akkermansia sp.]|nr:metallophosphoesterase family protein [Akkermansia sp.]
MPTIENISPPAGMLVRFVSDLHYGHERCEAPAPAELAERLLGDGVGMLVVVGDLAETRRCAWQERGMALREELRQECQRRGVQLIEIAGNHDPDAEPLLVRFWDGRVVAMHGHALYKEVAPWSWEYLRHKAECHALINSFPHDTLEGRLELSRRMCQLTAPILRREGVRNKYLRGFLHCFWPPQRPWQIVWCWLSCARRAARFAQAFFPEAQVIILGHFHRFGNQRIGKRHILNCGAWFKHATPYCVDMRDAQVLAYRKLV